MSGLLNGSAPVSEPVQDNSAYPVVVNTVLNLQRDTLAFWQNMTCFFNKWWYPEPDRITLPFCFFHITKYAERETLDLSTKRIIMYEPPEEGGAPADLKDPVRKGLMQTMADNVVIHPMEYDLEAIVPFLPFGRYVRQGTHMVQGFSDVISYFGGAQSGISQTAMDYITRQLKDVIGSGDMPNNAYRAMQDQDGIMADELKGVLSGDNQINKNSLDAMFRRGNIVQFKTWMGYDDNRYVIIKDKTMEKRSTEDDVWRVSLKLQEVPILSVTPVTGSVNKVDRSWVLNTINKYGATIGHPKASSEIKYFESVPAEEGADDSSTAAE